jgi:hypothetical protein
MLPIRTPKGWFIQLKWVSSRCGLNLALSPRDACSSRPVFWRNDLRLLESGIEGGAGANTVAGADEYDGTDEHQQPAGKE